MGSLEHFHTKDCGKNFDSSPGRSGFSHLAFHSLLQSKFSPLQWKGLIAIAPK
jgi:hypothetical protein